MNSLVSVIIPCYNAANTIDKALESVLNQTYRNLEIIVIDDGSVDNTFEILNAYAGNDSRIKVFRNESNIRLIKTLNRAVDLATGEYIARMDADDIAHPKRIETEYNFLKEGNFDLVSAGIKFFRSRIKWISKAYIPWILDDKIFLWASFFVPPVIHPAVFCKADVLKDNKYLFSAELLHIEDYELWHRLLLNKYRFGNIDKVLLYYRISPQSVSASAEELQKDNFINQAEKQIKNYFKVECSLISISILCNRIETGIRYADLKEAIKIHEKLFTIYTSINRLDKQETRAIRKYNRLFLFSIIFTATKKCVRKNLLLTLQLFFKYLVIVIFLKSPIKTAYRFLPIR